MSNEPTELERAVEQRGKTGAFLLLLTSLAGTVQMDEKTRSIIFGQVLGHLSAETARATARPWQYLVLVLLGLVVALMFYTNSLILQIALGVL